MTDKKRVQFVEDTKDGPKDTSCEFAKVQLRKSYVAATKTADALERRIKATRLDNEIEATDYITNFSKDDLQKYSLVQMSKSEIATTGLEEAKRVADAVAKFTGDQEEVVVQLRKSYVERERGRFAFLADENNRDWDASREYYGMKLSTEQIADTSVAKRFCDCEVMTIKHIKLYIVDSRAGPTRERRQPLRHSFWTLLSARLANVTASARPHLLA